MVILISLLGFGQTPLHTKVPSSHTPETGRTCIILEVVKSTLKIPPRHKNTIQIRIKGHELQDKVVYFISNHHTKKGLDPNIHVRDAIYNIKGKSMLYVVVANYTNKHVTFNKEQCIGHMEPVINKIPQTYLNSIITQKVMDDQFQLDAFTPPSHHLFLEVQ